MTEMPLIYMSSWIYENGVKELDHFWAKSALLIVNQIGEFCFCFDSSQICTLFRCMRTLVVSL